MSKNKPKIRFPEFTDDWEQRKVTELLKNTSDAIKIGPFGSALKKSFFTDKGIKVYAQENAFSGDFSIGNYYISEAKYNELKSCELKPGDLVISMMGTVGACAIFPENAEKGIMNSHLLRLQFSEEVLPEYIMFLLRDSQIIRDQIDRLSVGSIMTGLSSTVVKKLVFPVPKRPEQQKIVELLKQLDNLITLHQRKLDDLKVYKKGCLQKMFPRNGESVPEVRFPGFTDDWGQRKLGEIFEQTTNIVNPYERDIELWSLTVEDGLTPKTERYNRQFLVKKGDIFKEVYPGEIVYNPMNMTLGAVGYNDMMKSVAVSGYYTTMIAKENYDSYYINTWLKSPQAIFLYKAYATGSLLEKQRVQFSTLSIIPTLFPQIEEQKKIGNYFKRIDKLITLYQRKLDDIKEYKNGLLQQMFI